MLLNIKSVVKGTIIYGLANLSIKLIGIILIPIYTNYKYLTKNDFGVLGVIDISYQFVIIVFGLALYQSFARWYFDPDHKAAQKSMHFTVVLVNLTFCLISFAAIYHFAPGLSHLLFNTESYSKLIWLMFGAASLNIISSASMVLLRLQERALKYAVISITKLFVTLGVTIWFVVYRHMGLVGIYEAALLGELSGLILISSDIVKNSVPKFEGKMLVEMLGYGFPLLLAAVSSVLLNTFDRYSLNYLTDLDTVGSYTLAFRISNTIKVVVITSIQFSLIPLLYKKMGDKDHKRFYAKTMNYSTFIVMYLVLFLSLYSLEIVKVFSSNASYWDAANIIPILSLSMVFVLMKENVLVGLQITKSSAIMGGLIAFTAIINLAMNMLLIPYWKMYGAAFSTLISQLLMFILFYYVAQKKYSFPYELKNLIVLILSCIAVYFLSLISSSWEIIPRVTFKLILLLIWPFILLPLGFYEPIEIQRIKEIFNKYIGRLIF